jgi:hypothetical protein
MPIMRAVLVVSLVILFCPAAVLAQKPATSTATAASSAKPAKGGDITRAEYIERAVERAKRAAEKRFDKMDANHDGVLTADERRDARASRPPRRAKATQ